MTTLAPARPASRTASQRLFAGVLALLFAWHAMPVAVPATASVPVVHVSAAVPGVSAVREGFKLGQPTPRLASARAHAGPDGAPPPVLPPLTAVLAAPTPASKPAWVVRDAPALPRRTGDLYSARAPPHRS